ncbi:MAG: HD-GYP domain-containing protein [Pseudomonadota bacterium]
MDTKSIYPYLLGSIDVMTAALHARDAYTRFHCDRVVRLATELGDACDVVDAELDLLRICARFHDVGKIGVPDAVLLKPGKLDEEEWAYMKEHPVLGERIFAATGLELAKDVGKVIRHHHEAWDGSGYPDGLAGEEIPLLSRVLLVVDAYDAMTSSRPYHQARPHEKVMEILGYETGKKLDPTIMSEFEKVIESSPARAQ